MDTTVLGIIPDPKHPGDWLPKPCHGAPYGLWYGNLEDAIDYAEWVARDSENVEIRVYEPGGVLRERRVVKGTSGPIGVGAGPNPVRRGGTL